MCKSWCQPFILGAHRYFDFIGHGVGSRFWRRVVLSLFVCLFFSTPKVGDEVFLFSSLVLFCSSFKMFHFPTIYLGSGWFFFSVSPVGKVFFAFFYLFVCLLLFCFVLFFLFCFFASKNSIPPWYQNMVRPYRYSITQMMVDITLSTILNSRDVRAIQWKI